MDITFVGEHLFPGQLGHFSVVLGFVSALLALVSYFYSTREEKNFKSWRNLARISFWIHSASVLSIVASLFYIIYNHYFEYFYAWSHASVELPTRYIISCFWEGQEGSFLLWAFWQLVLGNLLIFTSKKWEPYIMTVLITSQVFLMSMLLGVYIGDFKIGSSPFVLLRNALEAPIFARADYLTFIKDGNGLNPLLQNYWMVIHPPTLFLGFASTIVPFAYAIAGLWRGKYAKWVRPALPWTLFSTMILGTGIIMGAFWAYEALNFGGYWAWDPVENASIIPWLTLVGSVHVLIVYKNSGHATFTAFFLVLITFILVLYASFLTRSGILGDSSVHAFTSLGMSGQLLAFLGVFIAMVTGMFIWRWKSLPFSKKEEQTYSREFWLFIGSLVLLISCGQIITSTSIPVFNAIFGSEIAPPADPISHYNKWQLPIAVIVLIISGFSQYLKFKKTDARIFWIQTGVAGVSALIVALLVAYLGGLLQNINYLLLIFACWFSVIINTRVLIDALKGKRKLVGSAIGHIGFALLLLGALISSAKSEVVSINKTGLTYGEDFDDKANKENVLLWRNRTVSMGDYEITYQGDSIVKPNIYYKVNYKKLGKNGEVLEDFTLTPNAQINEKMGLIASPDTRRYLTKDIYTHVTQVIVPEDENDEEAYGDPVTRELALGDTLLTVNGFIFLKELKSKVPVKNINLGKNDISVGALMEVNEKGHTHMVQPIYAVKDNTEFNVPAIVEDHGLKINFTKINPESGTITFQIAQKKKLQDDYIIMKAIVFPYINLLWGGTIIMVLGFLISMIRRIKESRGKSE
ncbi:MAG: cytochrome c-type biogenesis protein CcmF [Sphingobacteriales bacterium]|jgi:cytochrome c-type biogenesis protein CcmF